MAASPLQESKLVETVCPYCGKIFETYPSWVGKRRCSDCKGKDRKVEVECAWCSKVKRIRQSFYLNNKNKRFYCNFACKGKWLSVNRGGSANPNYKGGPVEVNCAICGKPKLVPTVRTRQYKYFFCCEKHKGMWNREHNKGSKSGVWKGGPIGVECTYCGKIKVMGKATAGYYKNHFCSKECFSKWMSENLTAERNSNWRGGKSFEPYPIEFNENLREAIRQRDDYKCQICGCSELENIEKLAVHHKDYDKNNCHPDNLVSLCHRHNSIVNFDRQKWIKYFARKNKKAKDKQLCFRR